MTTTATRRRRPNPPPAPTSWLGHPWVRGRGLHSSWLAPVYAAGVLALLALAEDLLPRPHGWWRAAALLAAIAVTLFFGALGTLSAAGTKAAGVCRLYMFTAGVCAGAWLSWNWILGAFNGPPWIVFGLAAFGFLVTWPAVRHAQINYQIARRRDPDPETTAVAVVEDKPPTMLEKAAATFASAGIRDVDVFERTPTAAGFAFHLGLQPGGATFTSIVSATDKIEVAFARWFKEGLRAGSVRVERARNAAGRPISDEVFVHFDYRDILSQIVWQPDDHTPMSVYDLFQVGQFADGTPIKLTIAELHAMIVGTTRYGKSNLLHVMIYNISRCYDAVIWFIDFKGGSTVRPWLQPYLSRTLHPVTGKPVKPVIDWAAIERTEAERILNAAIAAAMARPGIRAARPGGGGSKWRASAAAPAIFVLTDEIAEAVSSGAGGAYNTDKEVTGSTLGSLVTRGVCLGAGEAVWQWMAGQRGTVDAFAGGTAKANLGGRISFKQENSNDAGEVFQRSGSRVQAADMIADLEHPGSIVISGFGLGDEPRPGKINFMGDDEDLTDRVTNAAIMHSELVGTVDTDTAAALTEYGYATRYTDPDRTAWQYHRKPARPLRRFMARPDAPAAAPAAGTATAPAPRPVDPTNPFLAAFNGPTAARSKRLDDMPDADVAARWAELEAAHAGDFNEDEIALRDAATAAEVEYAEAANGPTGTPGYVRFVELVVAAGEGGISVPDLHKLLEAEGLAPADRTSMYTWRDKAVGKRLIAQPNTGRGGLLYAPQFDPSKRN